ncbi:follicle-stimulating hormone receptor isoform X2 [Nematostella vectensis]|nr:follicle-stimulating hormone receptor isoform X2 [Nematostella vectensis]
MKSILCFLVLIIAKSKQSPSSLSSTPTVTPASGTTSQISTSQVLSPATVSGPILTSTVSPALATPSPVTLTTGPPSPSGSCPSECVCSVCKIFPGSHALKCTVQDFDQFKPSYKLDNFTEACSLDFSKGNISHLGRETFRNFTALQELNLSYNNITRIRNRTFTNGSSLTTLSLDHNTITIVDVGAFYGLQSLLRLNLDYNNLVTLDQGCFAGLTSLRYLSIRYNKLKKWDAWLVYDAPHVTQLFIKGNKAYKITKQLLRNTTIQAIDEATISETCKQCKLDRVNVTLQDLMPKDTCQYLPDYILPVLYEKHAKYVLFEGECSGQKVCKIIATSMSKITQATRNYCWEILYDIRYFEFALGAFTIATNIIVVIATVSVKSLRTSTAFMLIGHMAMCDALIGIYIIGVAKGHGLLLDKPSVFRTYRYEQCPYYRSIYTLGQFMEVATSVLVTLERYLAIVFVMKRWVRMTSLVAAACLLGFWAIAATLASLMQVFDREVITDDLMCVLVRNFSHSEKLFFSQGTMLSQVLLYLLVIVMYVHIFVYVRRSQRNAGVQRESKLASRIGGLVLTNLLFFVVPNTVVFIVTTGTIYFETNAVANSMLRRWLPPICIVLNACMNPFLFAYRNDVFKTALKKQLGLVSSTSMSMRLTKSDNSTFRGRANTTSSVVPANEAMGMQGKRLAHKKKSPSPSNNAVVPMDPITATNTIVPKAPSPSSNSVAPLVVSPMAKHREPIDLGKVNPSLDA